jgi:hypothetical protein
MMVTMCESKKNSIFHHYMINTIQVRDHHKVRMRVRVEKRPRLSFCFDRSLIWVSGANVAEEQLSREHLSGEHLSWNHLEYQGE